MVENGWTIKFFSAARRVSEVISLKRGMLVYRNVFISRTSGSLQRPTLTRSY